MERKKNHYSIIICYLVFLVTCKSADIKEIHSLESEEYQLELRMNQFLFKSKNNDSIMSLGSLKKINNTYYLKTYDSIVSDEVYYDITESKTNGIITDSLKVIVNAPIERNCNNYESNNQLPFLISVSKRFDRLEDELKMQKKSFMVPRNGSYDVFIYPNKSCDYPISLDHLSFILYIYDDETNQIEINLPDLTYHRFGYLNFEDVELTRNSDSVYILKLGGDNISFKLKN